MVRQLLSYALARNRLMRHMTTFFFLPPPPPFFLRAVRARKQVMHLDPVNV